MRKWKKGKTLVEDARQDCPHPCQIILKTPRMTSRKKEEGKQKIAQKPIGAPNWIVNFNPTRFLNLCSM